jgi:hypothetical protein
VRIDQLVVLALRGDVLIGNQCLQVFVKDLVLLVGQFLEAGKRGIQRLFAVETIANAARRDLKALRPECLPSTSLFCAQPTSSARMIS